MGNKRGQGYIIRPVKDNHIQQFRVKQVKVGVVRVNSDTLQYLHKMEEKEKLSCSLQ